MILVNDFKYLTADEPDGEFADILGVVPKRWGRMDTVSRLVVMEVGRLLMSNGSAISPGPDLSSDKKTGLIVGTRYGCLVTDLAFVDSMSHGVETASPILFSYTLANIGLAEAASHYGLMGPVYAVYNEKPMTVALNEARRWLAIPCGIDAMIAGSVDVIPTQLTGKKEQISAEFVLVDSINSTTSV